MFTRKTSELVTTVLFGLWLAAIWWEWDALPLPDIQNAPSGWPTVLKNLSRIKPSVPWLGDGAGLLSATLLAYAAIGLLIGYVKFVRRPRG